MQLVWVGSEIACPKCKRSMQGYSVSYQHYKCPECRNEIVGLTIKSNQLEQIIGAICLIGLVSIFAAMLK